MVERIGKDTALAREAIRAAHRAVVERAGGSTDSAPAAGPSAPAAGADFARALQSGLERIDQDARSAETVPADLLTGKIDDFHEVAMHLKNAELSFKFAMEIRNKLVDAYREIMRMSV